MTKKIKNHKKKSIPRSYGYVNSHECLASSLNYLADLFPRPNAKFFGFIKTKGVFGFGLDINNEDYVAIHLFEDEEQFFDDDKDNNPQGKYIVLFYGIDNSSYGLRFVHETSRDNLLHSLMQTGYLDLDSFKNRLMFYNS